MSTMTTTPPVWGWLAPTKPNILALFICLFLAGVGTAASADSGPSFDLFDKLVTRQFFVSCFTKPEPFEFKREAKPDQRFYSAVFTMPPQHKDCYYICSIKVARAGTLLKTKEYQYALNHVPKQVSREAIFPKIGKRAMENFGGFGPGGSMFGLTFTTSDEKLDVRVLLANLSFDGWSDPNFQPDDVARKLAKEYDRLAEFADLDNGALRANAVKDIKSCVDYLVSLGIADPKRIGIAGQS